MTLCELVTLGPVLGPMYRDFLRNAHSHREANFLFMDWLKSIDKIPLPRRIESFDPEYVKLIEWLLIIDKEKRKTCAQTLDHPYISGSGHIRLSTGSKQNVVSLSAEGEGEVSRALRVRPPDESKAAPLFKGRLYKLNTGGDPTKPGDWLQRDAWLVQQGNLCYFSQR